MANHCWNSVSITGLTKENKERLIKWVNSYEKFTYMNTWVESIITLIYTQAPKRDLAPLTPEAFDAYKYGGRWFAFNLDDHTDDYAQISGDSAWSPMIGMCEVISRELECEVHIDYSESGSDFGGETIFRNGVEEILFEGSYGAYQYYSQGINAIIEDYEWVDTIEEYESILDGIREDIKNDADILTFREAFAEFDKELERDKALAKFLGA